MAKKGQIERLRIGKAVWAISGDAEIIVHRFSEKAAIQILNNQLKTSDAGREIRNPVMDMVRSLYLAPEPFRKFVFPAICIKKCMMRGAKAVGGTTMKDFATAVRVHGIDPEVGRQYVNLYGVPDMRFDIARPNRGGADFRFRAEFKSWYMTFVTEYNEAVTSPEQIAQLIEAGGWGCGLGDWRQERNGCSGTFGRIDLKEAESMRDHFAPMVEEWFTNNAEVIAKVRDERSQLYNLVKSANIDISMIPDDAFDVPKRIAMPKKSKKNGAQVEDNA